MVIYEITFIDNLSTDVNLKFVPTNSEAPCQFDFMIATIIVTSCNKGGNVLKDYEIFDNQEKNALTLDFIFSTLLMQFKMFT